MIPLSEQTVKNFRFQAEEAARRAKWWENQGQDAYLACLAREEESACLHVLQEAERQARNR